MQPKTWSLNITLEVVWKSFNEQVERAGQTVEDNDSEGIGGKLHRFHFQFSR